MQLVRRVREHARDLRRARLREQFGVFVRLFPIYNLVQHRIGVGRALDATEREKRIGDIATELFELRKAREESTSPEEEVVSAEFDVLFESHEKMAIDIAGQSLVVEKKQLSTWRFLSPLDEPEWRVCKIF